MKSHLRSFTSVWSMPESVFFIFVEWLVGRNPCAELPSKMRMRGSPLSVLLSLWHASNASQAVKHPRWSNTVSAAGVAKAIVFEIPSESTL
eukprot:COSAG01_NODE_193_length_22433_cov_91.669114_16_plen_91_part_00